MYQEMISLLPYPVSFVDTSYTYKAVNKEYTKYFNTSIENIINKKVYNFVDKELFNTKIKPKLDRCLQGENVQYEVEVLFSNGKLTTMQMNYLPYYDQNNNITGVVSYGKDITEDIEIQKMFQINPNITFITNGIELLQANDAFLDFTSYESIESFKENYECICDMFEMKNGYVGKYIENELWVDYIYKYPEKNCKALIVKEEQEFIFEIKVAKNKNVYLVLLYDVSEIIKKDKLLINQSRSAAMGDMIGMIAHQWRQPLSVLSMTANNMLADYDLDLAKVEDFKPYAQSILEQTNYLSKTIDDFRYFFKPNTKQQKQNIEELINNTLKFMDKSFANNNINIIKEFDCIGVMNVFVNELSHVIINLLKNAKEALLQRNIENKEIFIRTYKNNNTAFIEVEDTAKGIKSDIIDKVFDPYFSTKEKLNGTGLGLYMAKMIIEDHFKGTIEVKNSIKGARFIIKIPVLQINQKGFI